MPTDALRDILGAVDATAAADITLLAALLYVVLVALQRAQVPHPIRGALLLGGLYLITRQFGLALTAGVVEAFLLVLLASLVVIYRDEVLRLVNRLAHLARPRRALASADTLSLVLTDTLLALAAARCGALVVVRGDEEVEPFLVGGVRLDGEASGPLLQSIFDESSAGHDGAVVIDRGRVTSFAAHLPLSSNLEQLGARGTRHAAALGLSERCDALCLVVSQERGVVSLARAGTLRRVSDRDELREAIRERLHDRPEERSGAIALVRKNHGTKVVALLMALVAWLVLVYGGETVHRSFTASVHHRGAGPTTTVTVSPSQVRLVATGARRDFVLSGRSEIRVTVRVEELKPGAHTVRLAPEDVALPRGLSLRSVAPAEVRVRLVVSAPPPPP